MSCSADDRPDCIILAGGRGSRLNNQDKGLITLDGKPLIEHVIDCLAAEVNDIIISANRHQEQYRQYSKHVIADDDALSFQGPLAGIASCLPHCQQPLALVTSCDVPILPAGLTSRLLDSLAENDVSVCEVDGRLQAVFIVRTRCLPEILHALKAGEASLMRWIKQQPHSVVRFDEPAPAFVNVNTETDLHRLEPHVACLHTKQ